MPGKHHALRDLPLHLSPRRRLIVGIAVALLLFAAIGFRTGTSRHHPAQPVTPPPASASAEPSLSSSPTPVASGRYARAASPSASPSAPHTQTPATASTAPCGDLQTRGFGSGGGYRQGAGCPGQMGGPGYPAYGGGGPGGGGFGGFGGFGR
jgi:hypothetical protein